MSGGRWRGTTLACAVLSASCAGRGSAPRAADATTAFVGVNVVTMVPGTSVQPNQTVLVRNGRVTAIGPQRDVDVPARAVRIDAAGKYLMPGLTDAHAHLEYSTDPALLGLFLAHGVTTVRNMDGRPYILEWKREVAAGRLRGPTIFTAGPILDGDPPVRDDNTRIRNATEAVAAVREQARSGYDFVKVYINLSTEAYQAVLAAAREAGLPVAGHVPRRVAVEDALRSGQRAIEHLADYRVLIEADDSPVKDRWDWSKLYLAMPIDPAKVERAAALIARSGVWTVPTLVQAHAALVPPDSLAARLAAPEMAYIPADARAFWAEQARGAAERMDEADWRTATRGRTNRLAFLAALHRAGANILVGTDTPNPFVIPGYSVHQELELFVAAGFTPEQALAAATREPARFFGESNEWGTVEAGKRADLLLLECSPLASVRCARELLGVMARGRWYSREELREMLLPKS